MLEPTEVKLEPEMIQELPSGRFELDTTGLHRASTALTYIFLSCFQLAMVKR